MGRLVTFVVGILVGVVLKWQYDQQPRVAAPSSQPTERKTAPGQSAEAVQEIAITVEPSHRHSAAMLKPASPGENPATRPDEG